MTTAILNQIKNKKSTLSIQQINKLLLSVVNSVYLDKADTILGIPKIDLSNNIEFRFRDGRQIYDAKLTGDRLTYVESTIRRSDTYLEGHYLSDTIPSSLPRSYVDGLLDSTIRSDAKRRRCQRGKPCGDACIEKGDLCDRRIPPNLQQVTRKIRASLKDRNVGLGVAGVGVAALLGVGGLVLASNSASSASSTVSSKTNTPPRTSQNKNINSSLLVTAGSDPPVTNTQKIVNQLEDSTSGGALITARPQQQVEVTNLRNATVEEKRLFRRRNTTASIENTEVITPDPRSKTRSQRGLPAAGEPALAPLNEFTEGNFADKPEDIKRIASKGTIPGRGRVRAGASVKGFEKEDTQRLQDTLNRIDKILPKLPELSPITVEPMAASSSHINKASGLYNYDHYLEKNTNVLIDRIPKRIEINSSPTLGVNPELTLIHEVGHYLDHAATGTTKELSGSAKARMKREGEPDPPPTAFDEFFKAVQATPTTKRSLDKWRSEKDSNRKEWLNYSLQNEEVLARAFTQYVAVKSSSETIKKQLKSERKAKAGMYWTDAEFKTLEPVMDKMFKELGWR